MQKEVTFREIIEKAGEFFQEYWRYKLWIILVAVLLGSFFAYRAQLAPVRYTAKLTYTLNDGKAGGGALSGILGSFGIGGVSKVNLEKLVSLSLSRNLIQKMLFTKVALDTFGGKEDYIANHLMALHQFRKAWSEDAPGLENWAFTHDSIENFQETELWVLKKLVSEVTGSKDISHPIFSSTFDATTGMLTMSASTVDEQLAIEICRTVFADLRAFYISTNQQSQQSTIKYAMVKTDSVFHQLKSREYALSRFNDTHRNLQDMQVMTERRLLEAEILKLKTLYAEATKNKELAEFSLNSGGVPDMLLIDEPLMPLDSDFQPWWLAAIKGMLVGTFAMLLLFSFRKMVKDAYAAT